MERLLPLIHSRKYDLGALISHRLPLAEGPRGYDLFDRKLPESTMEPRSALWIVRSETLLDGDPIPPVDPLGANLEKEECAEDTGGLPDIALPPAPAPNPVVTTTTAQATGVRVSCIE